MVNFTPKLVEMPSAAQVVDLVVEDIMHKSFLSFSEEMPIGEVIKRLSKSSEIGGPVLTEDKRLVGFITEKTCLEMMAASRFYNCETPIVSHFMSQELHSIPANTQVYKVVDLFLNNWFHMYPVMEHGRVIGMVTRKMVIRSVQKEKKTTW
jgi:CBS-domain-containing membrane protein